MSATACAVVIAPKTRSIRVRTGLNAAETGCRAKISATSAV